MDDILKGSTTALILDALVAYSLSSSSTVCETVSYFLATRTAQIKSLTASRSPDALIDALSVFDSTLGTVKSLFPAQFMRSFTRTTVLPLLEDSEIRRLPQIDFSVLGDWAPTELLRYTVPQAPDETELDVIGILKSFESDAVSAFEDGIRSVITSLVSVAEQPAVVLSASETAIQSLLDLRRAIFESLIVRPAIRPSLLADSTTWGKEWLPALAKLCMTYLDATEDITVQLSDIVKDKSSSKNSELGVSSLWDDKWMSLDISRGALDFRTAVSALLGGKSSVCGQTIDSIKGWWEAIQNVHALVGKVSGVYEYDSFAGEEEGWIKAVRENAESESKTLQLVIDNEVVPNGIRNLVNKIESLLAAAAGDESNIGNLVRVARRIGELPMTSESIQVMVSDMVESSYKAFAEKIFDDKVSAEKLRLFFESTPAIALWEEEQQNSNSASAHTRYPSDVSPWLFEGVYASYVTPVVEGGWEDVVIGSTVGVTICRNIVGTQWSERLYSGMREYLESIDCDEISEPLPENSYAEVENEITKADSSGTTPTSEAGTEEDAETEVESVADSKEAAEKSSVDSTENDDEANDEAPTTTDSHVDLTDAKSVDFDASLAEKPAEILQKDSKPTKNHWIQLLFDILYLQYLFTMSMEPILDIIVEHLDNNMDEEEKKKLLPIVAKRVEACWKRTYLLYAIM